MPLSVTISDNGRVIIDRPFREVRCPCGTVVARINKHVTVTKFLTVSANDNGEKMIRCSCGKVITIADEKAKVAV